MTVTQGFQSFYESELRAHLEQFEGRRRQIASRVLSEGAFIAAGGVALAAAMIALFREPGAGFVGLIVGAIAFFWRYTVLTRSYIAEFKDTIIGRIVAFVDPNLTYHRTQYIPQSVYWRSQLFLKDPDRYRGEDMVQGTVGQTAVQFSEIHSEYKTVSHDSKGRRKEQWHTIFKGIYFVADFNKHFRGLTVVLPDTAEKLFGRFGQTLQSWSPGRGELVKLEDPEFERRFVVYSEDQVEARYLLSTSLMARIVAFAEKTGHAVFLSFEGSSIHVAITHWADMFEPRIFQSVTDPKLVEGYLQDLLLAVGIVEELNLNTRIWTKE